MPRPRFPIEVRARRGQRLGMSPAHFLRGYWQKRPLLVRNAFAGFTPPLDPDDLAGLACLEGALARIVSRNARRKRWELRSGPFDDATFASLPDSDWTLLVQDVDKWDADTSALLDAFAFIPSWRIDDVMVSYATDRGGVGPHVDQYDVFLLQGLGRRRWAIDTRPDPSVDFRDDVELKLLTRFSPTHQWTLQPGDLLYLPPGVPHEGVAVGECMTFSVGMRAPSAAEMLTDFAQSVAEQLPEAWRYSDPDARVVRESGEIDAAALARAARAMPWLRIGSGSAGHGRKRARGAESRARRVPASLLRAWFGRFITRYRAAQAPAPRKRPIDREFLARCLPGTVLERDPWARFAWCRSGSDAILFASGSAFDAPTAWARELAACRHELDGARLAKLPQRARGIALLAALVDSGHLRLRRGQAPTGIQSGHTHPATGGG